MLRGVCLAITIAFQLIYDAQTYPWLLQFFQFTLQIYMRQMNLLIQIGDLIVVAPEPHGALAEYTLIHFLYVVGTRVIECLEEVL